MNHIRLILFTLVVSFSIGCTSSNQELYALKKYQTTNPKLEFEHDKNNQKTHFLGVQGFALVIPEVGLIEKEICFGNVDLKIIDKSGDSFDIDMYKAMELKSGARKYAGKYNQLLKKHLVDRGSIDCNPEANWGLAFDELNEFIWGNPVRHGSGLGMSLERPISFTISLVNMSLSEETTTKACEIFNRHRIEKRVLFNLHKYKKEDREWLRTEIATFYCENGNRVELSYINSLMTGS